MRIEEWMGLLSEAARKNEYRFESLRTCIPLGVYPDGNIATAHREEKPDRYHYLLVSGAGKREFILRLVATLSRIYDKNEAQFLVLSPYTDYADFLSLAGADFTVPYITGADDFEDAIKTVTELVSVHALRVGAPRLIVVAEGLETVEGIKHEDVTDPYARILAAVGTSGAEVIAGVNLTESAFAGYPGAVVGIGNCLVSVKSTGKADVTHVGADSSLGVPREILYPYEPEFKEVVSFLNSMEEE